MELDLVLSHFVNLPLRQLKIILIRWELTYLVEVVGVELSGP
jgi:hypothetical protein